jgi:hypothetical protein
MMATASASEPAMVANHGNQECLRRNANAACSLGFNVTRPEICTSKSWRVYLVSFESRHTVNGRWLWLPKCNKVNRLGSVKRNQMPSTARTSLNLHQWASTSRRLGAAPPHRVDREVFDTLLYGHFMLHKENTSTRLSLACPNIWERKFRWSSMCLIPNRLARRAGS